MSCQVKQINHDDTFRALGQGKVYGRDMVQIKLVGHCVLFPGCQHAYTCYLYSQVLHSTQTISVKFWPSGINVNFVGRSCGIGVSWPPCCEKLLRGLCHADTTLELSARGADPLSVCLSVGFILLLITQTQDNFSHEARENIPNRILKMSVLTFLCGSNPALPPCIQKCICKRLVV